MNVSFKMKRKHYIFIVVSIFIITNPNTKAFKEYLGRDEYGGLKREYNFFVCSYYTARNTGEYLGILGNFFVIQQYQPFNLNKLFVPTCMSLSKIICNIGHLSVYLKT